ncbi:unnamed protein product [Microthlaspi erraticum]|uniref:F-box domain-containing protein n=1 Tax=Microthlaspi erraticum TaxID=1685480 RepID=A0A6D2JXK0_9BRAS|nr:unnamed protein product [Microthlaspi erraticum]
MSQGNNRSSNLTKREKKSEPTIPTDLIIEIFSRLPGKSVARFRCLSKLWSSTLRRPYFTELFLTRSSARPRLLFVLKEDLYNWTVFSSPQPHKPYGKSSLIVTADFHMKIRGKVDEDNCSYTSGLIYFPDIWIKGIDAWDTQPVVCNPITGRYAILPVLIKDQDIQSNSALGFDPIHKQFKGRLGGISWGCDDSSEENLELRICVLEDVETQKWSEIVYSFGENALVGSWDDYVVRVTAAGEIVLSPKDTTKQFYVFFFSPERNTLQKVEIRGLTDNCSVHVFVDHVEDIDVDDANQLKSRPVKKGLEITRKRPEPPK